MLLTLQRTTTNQRWKKTLNVGFIRDYTLPYRYYKQMGKIREKTEPKVTQMRELSRKISGFDIWSRVYRNIITNDDIQRVIFPLMSSLNISYNEIWKDVQNRFVVSGIKYHYCTDPVLAFQIKLFRRNMFRFPLFVKTHTI